MAVTAVIRTCLAFGAAGASRHGKELVQGVDSLAPRVKATTHRQPTTKRKLRNTSLVINALFTHLSKNKCWRS